MCIGGPSRLRACHVLACILAACTLAHVTAKAAESCKEADIKKECAGLTTGDVNTKQKCETACYDCLGGDWGCGDFKIGSTAGTFKCDCSKKQSGTCKYTQYDGICKDPGYTAGAYALRPLGFGLAAIACANAILLWHSTW